MCPPPLPIAKSVKVGIMKEQLRRYLQPRSNLLRNFHLLSKINDDVQLPRHIKRKISVDQTLIVKSDRKKYLNCKVLNKIALFLYTTQGLKCKVCIMQIEQFLKKSSSGGGGALTRNHHPLLMNAHWSFGFQMSVSLNYTAFSCFNSTQHEFQEQHES